MLFCAAGTFDGAAGGAKPDPLASVIPQPG
jgi:hypothetical protein